MLVAPAGKRVVDVDQLLGKLVQLEPAVRVAVDLDPGGSERLDRAVADVEPCALERGDRSVAQARLVERRLEARTVVAPFGIMGEVGGVLEPEAVFDLAELCR